MNSKRIVTATIVMVLSSVLLIALVGARGSFGFGKGSVVAFGEIQGDVSDNANVFLQVKKHPDAAVMQFYVSCQGPSGTISEGERPVRMIARMRSWVNVSQLEKLNGAVIVGHGQLVANLNDRQMSRLRTSACPEANSTIIDAFPVGFEATVQLRENGQVINELKYVCGTTIRASRSPFSNGSMNSGSEYECSEM